MTFLQLLIAISPVPAGLMLALAVAVVAIFNPARSASSDS